MQSEKDLTLKEMLKKLGHQSDEVIDGEFVEPATPAEQIEEVPAPPQNEKTRILVALGIGAVISLPVIFLLTTTGGKVAQTPKENTTVSAATTASADKEKQQRELEDAKTSLWLQSQKEAQSEASPSPSASVDPSPPSTPKVSASPSVTIAPTTKAATVDSASSPKIASLEDKIARLETSLAKKQAPQMIARSAPTIQKQKQPTQIARVTPQSSPIPSPSAKPAASTQPKAQTAQVAKATPTEKKASWEEIASAGSYGGKEEAKAATGTPEQPSESMAGSIRLPVGVSVAGHTAGPIAVRVGSQNTQQEKNGQVLSVATEQAIQVTGGWSIPAGSVIEFAIATDESGLIQGTSKKVFIGNEEVKIPAGAFGLSTPSGEPLMANVSQPNGDQIADADAKGATWGALSEVGKALAGAGDTNTISNSGLGSTLTSVKNPSPNILGAGASGAFGVLAKRNTDRAEALNKRAEKQGYVATLRANTKVQVFILQAAAFNPPGGAYTEAPPPAPPTIAETDSDVLEAVSRKRKQMATTLTPINEQKPPLELPKSLRGMD